MEQARGEGGDERSDERSWLSLFIANLLLLCSLRQQKPKLHVKTNQTAELLGRVRGKVKCVGVGAPTIKFSDLPFADEATSYGSFVQLRSVGFLSNVRQHRQFGLAVLETSQFMTRNPDAGWRECFTFIIRAPTASCNPVTNSSPADSDSGPAFSHTFSPALSMAVPSRIMFLTLEVSREATCKCK